MEEFADKLTTIVETYFAPTEKSIQGFEKLRELVDHFGQSFGGCALCWGKGYVESGPDEERPTRVYDYCECPRGDQLRKWEVLF